MREGEGRRVLSTVELWRQGDLLCISKMIFQRGKGSISTRSGIDEDPLPPPIFARRLLRSQPPRQSGHEFPYRQAITLISLPEPIPDPPVS